MTSEPSSFCSLESSASAEANPVKTISSTSSCKALDHRDGVLQAVDVAVNDVDIHLDPRAVHADRVEDAGLAIHLKMLADGVDDAVVGGKIDRLGVLDHVLHVLLGDFAVGGNDGMNAVIVEAADVVAGDAQIDAADFDIGHLLGLDDGVAHVLLGQRRRRRFRLCARRASGPGRRR